MTLLLVLALALVLMRCRALWLKERTVRTERDALRSRNAELWVHVLSTAEAAAEPSEDRMDHRFSCTPDFRVNPNLAEERAERARRASPMLKALRREMR